MQKLKIIFSLASEIVFKNSIRFDGLLTFLKVAANNNNTNDVIEIPLQKVVTRYSEDWFYDCSNGVVEGQVCKQLDNVKKQINVDGLNMSKINISSGIYCSNVYKFERIQAESVIFYVIGDKKEIVELLSGCTHLGAMRKNDFGRIKKVEIIEQDFEHAYMDGNILRRDIPLEVEHFTNFLKDGVILSFGKYRPPYNPEFDQSQFLLLKEGSNLNAIELDFLKK